VGVGIDDVIKNYRKDWVKWKIELGKGDGDAEIAALLKKKLT